MISSRDRQVGVLIVAGFTHEEAGRKLGIPLRTIARIIARPDVKAYIAERDAVGLTPWDRLEALMYSKNEQVALRASVELAKLGPRPAVAVTHSADSHRPVIQVLAALPPVATA
jgi:hypothetical protein